MNIELKEPESPEDVILLAVLASARGKFDLGDVAVTNGVMENFRQPFVILCLTRHRLGDWGALDDEDKEANDNALHGRERLLSAYLAPNGEKLYVITEWDRKLTTVLMPDEY
jgi:hypothetical protein